MHKRQQWVKQNANSSNINGPQYELLSSKVTEQAIVISRTPDKCPVVDSKLWFNPLFLGISRVMQNIMLTYFDMCNFCLYLPSVYLICRTGQASVTKRDDKLAQI